MRAGNTNKNVVMFSFKKKVVSIVEACNNVFCLAEAENKLIWMYVV